MLAPNSYPVQENITMLVGPAGQIKRIDCSLEAPPEQAKVKTEIARRYKISVVMGPWRRDGSGWTCSIIQQMTGRR